MTRLVHLVSALCLPVIVIALTATPGAQAPAASQTASDFYMQYRKAFEAAKKIEDLLPYMSAATRKQIESTPAAERGQMFEMVKLMGTLTSVKITKETRTDTGATLTVDALDSDKAKTAGTITMVREGGAWKIGRESWSTK